MSDLPGDFIVSLHHTDKNDEPQEGDIPISEERAEQFAQIMRDTEGNPQERAERIKGWAFALWASNLMGES